MKLNKFVKAIFLVLFAALIVSAVWMIKDHRTLATRFTASGQPAGTCSPNITACPGNPKLCMDENKAPVCN